MTTLTDLKKLLKIANLNLTIDRNKTFTTDNTAMISVLNKNGFEISNKFKNIKTGNVILTFQKNL